MKNHSNLIAHICMLMACAIWGLMAPLGKHAMTHGVPGLEMVCFRVVGGALCFWIASAFVPQEKVKSKDLLLFFFAGMLSIVFNQCCYTIGLSITSPVNASIMTTTMPIVTMVLAALFLHEPVTSKKVIGIFLGAIGAFILITGVRKFMGHRTKENSRATSSASLRNSALPPISPSSSILFSATPSSLA